MQVALICPPALLKKYGSLTRYHLVLPHLFRERRYRDFYLNRSKEGDYLILDNGAAEGLRFGVTHLYTVAEKMGVHEIVVPDVIGDMDATISKALAFTRYTREGYRYQLVAQGSTIPEVVQCINYFMTDTKFMYATCIGIPRHINKIDGMARMKISEYILESGFDRAMEFHYLGASHPFNEVLYLAAVGLGRGIDTSAPIYMGRWGMVLDEHSAYRARPKDFFKINRVSAEWTEKNILTYLEWALYDRDADLPERPETSTS